MSFIAAAFAANVYASVTVAVVAIVAANVIIAAAFAANVSASVAASY